LNPRGVALVLRAIADAVSRELVLACVALRALADHVEQIEDMEKRLHERHARFVKRVKKARRQGPSWKAGKGVSS
jgi:hypothetical protein